MSKRKERNTKGKIVSAAWRLFYEQGYEETTVEEIIEESGTSRGSFYHYFTGKDALLGTLSYLFDEKYGQLVLPPDMDRFDMLMYINGELFGMIERTVPLELLARMYATQLITKGEKHLLDRKRTYYRLLRRICAEGQERGEITRDVSVEELAKVYALCERALMYDWCICNGEYSLKGYAAEMMPVLMSRYRSKNTE